MAKKLKPCFQCAELAAERDRLLSFKELYETVKEQKAELQTSLERAWKLINQLTEAKQKQGGNHA